MDVAAIVTLPSVGLADKRNLPAEPGVYFAVVNGERIAYVGATGDLRDRWRKHNKATQLMAMGDVRVHFLLADYEGLCNVEQDAIELFAPCLNQAPAIWIRRETPGVYLPAALDRPIGRPRTRPPAQ